MTNFVELMQAASLTPRTVQQRYADAVSAALDLNKVSLFHADTGVGKSLGYLVPALQYLHDHQQSKQKPRVIIATHSHALMAQLLVKESKVIEKIASANNYRVPTFGRLIGRANYFSPERLKTLAYQRSQMGLSTIGCQNMATWDGTIAEFIEEYGDLPYDLEPNQVCLTPECSSSSFDATQKNALNSDIVITTHAMICVDVLHSGALLLNDHHKTCLIIDEADQFVSSLTEYQRQRLNLVRLKNALGQHLVVKNEKKLDNLMDQIRSMMGNKQFEWGVQHREVAINAQKTVCSIIAATMKKLSDAEQTALLPDVREWLHSSNHLHAEIGLGLSQIRHEPSIVILNPFFGRLFAKYSTKYASTILTSGTLSITDNAEKGMSWIRHDLGLNKQDIIGRQDIFTPDSFGLMTFSLAGSYFPKPYVFNKGEDDDKYQSGTINQEWLTKVADHISKHDSSRIVVLTASHAESDLLTGKLKKFTPERIIHQHKAGEPLRDAVAQFTKAPSILITAAGHVGLDIRSPDGALGFDDLIITRIPYPKPDHDLQAALDHLMIHQWGNKKFAPKNQFAKAINSTIRRLKQAFGRGIRSNFDHIHITILDPRFPRFEDTSSKHLALRYAIPLRFKNEYAQATIVGETTQLDGELYF